MIILEVRPKNPMEVSLVDHDHVIQTITSDRSDEAFNVRILPWRVRGSNNFLYAHAFDAGLKLTAVLFGKTFWTLLYETPPFGIGMVSLAKTPSVHFAAENVAIIGARDLSVAGKQPNLA